MASSATAVVKSMANNTELFCRRVGSKGASSSTGCKMVSLIDLVLDFVAVMLADMHCISLLFPLTHSLYCRSSCLPILRDSYFPHIRIFLFLFSPLLLICLFFLEEEKMRGIYTSTGELSPYASHGQRGSNIQLSHRAHNGLCKRRARSHGCSHCRVS